jgi:hypothetical protein
MSKIGIFPISRFLLEFFLLNLKIAGFIFLAINIHNQMKKIPAKGIFISTSRLALVCF